MKKQRIKGRPFPWKTNIFLFISGCIISSVLYLSYLGVLSMNGYNMNDIEIKLYERVSDNEIIDPVYYMGDWFSDWRNFEDMCEMDIDSYIVKIIIKQED